MKIKAIRGARDLLPQELKIWDLVEEKARESCEIYGYRQIRTPLLEEARLFTRSIGEASDIVRKEMYSFLDRKKRRLCLRPEATASVVRAYLEHGFDKNLNLAKFYYFGPMFRAERPQAGRLRQFHHLGAEAIGSLSPYLDAEVISLAVNILQEIGIKDFTLQLSTIGCPKDRQSYKAILKKALKNKIKSLCSDCRARYRLNLLRIFDCKNESCKKLTAQLPAIFKSLCCDCEEHFSRVKEALHSLGISYTLNPHLVRGLDYYTKTCFEITHPRLGAQNALGAGGRYDNLVHDLGGPQIPAIGFALGVERLIALLDPTKIEQHNQHPPLVYCAVAGEGSKQEALKMLYAIRKAAIISEMDYQDKSLKAQMRQADKLGAKFVVIFGEEELKKQTVILRDMQTKDQKEVRVDELVKELMAKARCH